VQPASEAIYRSHAPDLGTDSGLLSHSSRLISLIIPASSDLWVMHSRNGEGTDCGAHAQDSRSPAGLAARVAASAR
jgi:hypothetical protein